MLHLQLIEVSRLRVGMFVQIDANAPARPLPLGGFLINNERQLAQVRALSFDPASQADDPASAPPTAEVGSLVEVRASTPVDAAPDQQRLTLAKRRALVARQQACLERCEQQFGETSRQLCNVFQNVRANPIQMRQIAVAQVERRLVQDHVGHGVALGKKMGLPAVVAPVAELWLHRKTGTAPRGHAAGNVDREIAELGSNVLAGHGAAHAALADEQARALGA